MGKKTSLKDIANKVGVSTALVSYVLNGLEKEKRVGPELALKIKEAATALNYTPNQIARSLRKGTTNTIGLILADIANPFFGQLARIIEDEAAKFNYIVIYGSSDENCLKSASLVETFLDRQVDGFIIVPSEGCREQLESLGRKEMPLVLIDRYLPGLATNYVVLDNYGAVYDAVNHLISMGRKNVAMVAYKSSLVHMEERTRGYRQAMAGHGLENSISVHAVDYYSVREEVDQIINQIHDDREADAVVFATNALTISGLYAIQKYNIKVPEELAVIGFDGNEAFDFFNPPLTYIRQPLEEMGREAVRVLLDQIKGPQKIQQMKYKHQLIKRSSCG
jgi:LacI family transcriptional regulator